MRIITTKTKLISTLCFFLLIGFSGQAQMMQEVIEGYDVDGIQGDDRLPAMPVEGGYSEYTKELYRQENGGQDPTSIHIDPRWIQWRSNKLTQFGGQLYRMVKHMTQI